MKVGNLISQPVVQISLIYTVNLPTGKEKIKNKKKKIKSLLSHKETNKVNI